MALVTFSKVEERRRENGGVNAGRRRVGVGLRWRDWQIKVPFHFATETAGMLYFHSAGS